MYSENVIKDAISFSKAVASNQLAGWMPSVYVNLKKETGRGFEPESSEQVSEYFKQCFFEYFSQLRMPSKDIRQYLNGKRVLEYGPGDVLGVAVHLYANGAEQVHCVDQFPLEKISEKNSEIYSHILESLDDEERRRATTVFHKRGDPTSGFDPEKIHYFVTPNGLSGEQNQYDLVISRAVLEHVNDLEKTFFDIKNVLKKDGFSLHKVDLKSHGLDRYRELDFLTWPNSLYRLMFSHKGFPNRWRIDRYKKEADKNQLKIIKLVPTETLDAEKLKVIRPSLAKQFRQLSNEELSCLGFWMVLGHA